MKTRVRTDELNLRATPSLSGPIVSVLKKGRAVEIMGPPRANGFVAVRLEQDGRWLEGHLWGAFLESLPAPTPARPHAVHLKPPLPIRRTEDTGHAYPLYEPDQPAGRGDRVEASDLLELLRWLRVADSKHLRYRPKPGVTYCNVYAYDYCYLAGVYLPRVWWSQSSLNEFESGRAVHPEYGKTVGELSANALFHWLEGWSARFGWARAATLDELQQAANAGEVAVVSGRRHDPSEPGHISIVAPESDQVRAVRKGQRISVPVQSQAGGTLLEYGNGEPWWTGNQFAEVGFWRHA